MAQDGLARLRLVLWSVAQQPVQNILGAETIVVCSSLNVGPTNVGCRAVLDKGAVHKCGHKRHPWTKVH